MWHASSGRNNLATIYETPQCGWLTGYFRYWITSGHGSTTRYAITTSFSRQTVIDVRQDLATYRQAGHIVSSSFQTPGKQGLISFPYNYIITDFFTNLTDLLGWYPLRRSSQASYYGKKPIRWYLYELFFFLLSHRSWLFVSRSENSCLDTVRRFRHQSTLWIKDIQTRLTRARRACGCELKLQSAGCDEYPWIEWYFIDM